jgi:hypothetical protein
MRMAKNCLETSCAGLAFLARLKLLTLRRGDTMETKKRHSLRRTRISQEAVDRAFVACTTAFAILIVLMFLADILKHS